MPENNTHDGNYVGTTNMHAKNQDMAFVNDTLEEAMDQNAIVNYNEEAESEKNNHE